MAIEISSHIIETFNNKYAEPVGLIVLCKCLSAISVLTDKKPLSIITISFSQCFKSRTSIETKEILPDLIEEWGSDFTIHSLMRKYENGKKMENKIGSVNDMTILFMSKSDRGSSRLLGALAESLTEGEYHYSERQMDIEWSPKRYAIIGNLTFERYKVLKEVFESSTFNERFLRLYYTVKTSDFKRFNREREERIKIKMNPKLSITKIKKRIDKKSHSYVPLTESQKSIIEKYSDELKIIGNYSSLGTTNDIIESILYSNALLNNRSEIEEGDFRILQKIINKLIVNKLDKTCEISRLLYEGYRPKEIIEQLGYNKKSGKYVYRHINNLKLRGVIFDQVRYQPDVPPIKQVNDKKEEEDTDEESDTDDEDTDNEEQNS